jgi:hypothetical protein
VSIQTVVNPTTTTITIQPAATQTVIYGNTAAAISVTAAGANLAYQWYSNSANATTGGTPISGATNSTYTPAVNSSVGTLYYYCVVSGTCGNATTTTQTVTVTKAPLTIIATAQSKPYGTTLPTTGTINTNFTVTGLAGQDVISSLTLTYTGSPAGNLATASVGAYTITPSDVALSTGLLSNYTLVYTNGTLTVNPRITPPVIFANGPTTFCNGGSVTLTTGSTALSFNGSTQNANLPALGITTNTMTMEAWVYANGTQNAAAGLIFARGNTTLASGLGFGYANSTKIGYTWNNTGSTYNWTGGPTYPLNTWFHIALVIEPTKATIYLNGVPYVNNVANAAVNFADIMQLATDNCCVGRNFNGQMKEVRIWTTARTQAEVQSDITSTATTATGLKAYYKLNESTGTTIADAAAALGTGTLIGSPSPTAYNSYSWSPGGATTPNISATTSGTYTVTVTDAYGVTASASQVVTVNDLPALSNNTGGASSVCVNATTPAFTNAQSGGTWSIVLGTGTASVSLGGAVTGLTAGTVSVIYAYNNGTCSNSVSRSVTVTPNMTGGVATSTPTLCINTPLTNINHTTEVATGIGTATGLPAGVTAAWISNTITISGTPTEAGAFNYSIPLTGGCGSVNATGSITVNDMPSPPTITGDFDFCAGSTTTLSAGGDSSRQYAATVLGFSSEYTSNCGPFSSCKVLGAPNVYPNYGDLAENWANASPNGGLEYLNLGFSNPTPISFVDIYETFSPGSVTQVSVKNNTTGLYEVVYNATAAPAPGVARILHITFPLTNYDVSAVRIDMDTALFGTWIEIDAVAIGAENPDTYLWSNGQTTSSIAVTTEGEYSVTVTNADGCSATSEVTTVIVNQPAIETTVATSCGMYVWEAGNYSDYYESGTYSYTENCVTHILELTVIEPTTETTVATSCGMYIWPINGSDYMTSGSYSYDTQDCVHHILELTVSPLSIPTTTASGSTTFCQGESINLTVDNESNVDTLPLNEVGGATLAVGLRKLKSDYAGSALRLRRSSDNQEQDFGFAGDDLDTVAISTWLDGADGFCTTLYDQSGNGGHVTQSDVNAQPIYVAAGINNKPILHFNTAQSMFNEVNYPAPFSAIYGARMTGTSARLLASRYNNWLLGYWNGYMDVAFFEGFLNNGVGPEADNSFNIFAGTGNGNISTVYKNGTQLYSDSGGVDGPNGIQLNGSNDEYSDCDFTDVMLFGTELSSQDIVKLNTSISNYYTTNNSSSNAVSYLWSNGATTPSIEVSTAGDYTVTVTNSAGCSATSAATAVIVNSCEVPTGQISGNASLCAGNSTQLSIALTGQGPWFGTLSDGTGFSGSDNPLLVTVTPSETTTYTIATLSSETATASVTDLSGSAAVSVIQSTTETTVTASCDNYTWSANGQSYSTSGTYTSTGLNAAGCTDTKTLVLTINNSTSESASETACDSYTWTAGTGDTYTASGTYTSTSTNAAGCTHTKTLVLTINNSSSDSASETACDSYTWTAGTGTTYTASGTYTSTGLNAAGCTLTKTLVLTINPCESVVTVKMNIQGYYDADAHAMRAVMANQGVGSSATDVDDVTVELRNSTTNALVVSTTARLKTDGTATATFVTAPSGSFYIAVKHRNAIQTWSSAPQTVGATPLTYDFTTAANKAYGDNMIQLESGVYGFYSGDLNQDEAVDIFDFPLLLNDNDNFSSGYLSTDLNGDGAVDIFDFPLLLNNNDNFIYSSHP